MHKNDIKLIAMDMDGTLLNSKQQISPGNATTLRKAAEQGIQLAICSGRAPADIALFAQENGLYDCALLGLNGTHSWLRPDGTVLASHALDEETLEKTLEILWEANIIFTCFSRNNLVVFRDDEGRTDHAWLAHKGVDLKLLRGMSGLEQVMDAGVNKIVCLFPDADSVAPVREKLLQIDGLEVSSSWIDNLELMPAGFNKGTAVAELAAYMRLDASQVMAFGDFDNDLPMIKWAGWGTAMGNANASVKRAAKLITRTNDEDGVGWAIEQYALK